MLQNLLPLFVKVGIKICTLLMSFQNTGPFSFTSVAMINPYSLLNPVFYVSKQ